MLKIQFNDQEFGSIKDVIEDLKGAIEYLESAQFEDLSDVWAAPMLRNSQFEIFNNNSNDED